jgi:predicted methyltransferase MtxX (methanogen marker protein 4)
MAMARTRVPTKPARAIPTRFTESELARIDGVRSLLGIPSRSQLIREAVAEKLAAVETTGILELRDMSVDEAVKRIDGYLKQNPGTHWVSEFIERLGIEPKVAFEAVQRLVDTGRVKDGKG